jgi:hypothetical protein
MFKPAHTSSQAIHFITVSLNPQDSSQDSIWDSILLFKGVDIVRRQCFDDSVYHHPIHPSNYEFDIGNDKTKVVTNASRTNTSPRRSFRFEVIPSHHHIEVIEALKPYVASPRQAAKFHSSTEEYQVLWDDFKAYIDHEVSSSQQRMRGEVGEMFTANNC